MRSSLKWPLVIGASLACLALGLLVAAAVCGFALLSAGLLSGQTPIASMPTATRAPIVAPLVTAARAPTSAPATATLSSPVVRPTTPPANTPTPSAPPAGAERVFGSGAMVFVPAGDFTMGSDDEIFKNERPVHTVTLDGYWIDKTEVTNAQYAKCVAARACREPARRESFNHDDYYGNPQYGNYPVIHVLWSDADGFCRWDGKRLPTEAEWEKAARGTDGRVYPWGDLFEARMLNSNEGRAGDTTAVGSYPGDTSPYGALDMAGNVHEWTADWYSENYYQNAPSRNPQGPPAGPYEYHSRRGGAWDDYAYDARASSRSFAVPAFELGNTGFRCARSN